MKLRNRKMLIKFMRLLTLAGSLVVLTPLLSAMPVVFDRNDSTTMDQLASAFTIWVDDLAVMRNFYEHTLGWKPIATNKNIVFYKVNNSLFSIGRRADLSKAIGPSPPDGSGFRRVAISYSVQSEQELRDWYAMLKRKGVKIVQEPVVPPFGGLLFCFQDVEGNIFGITYNSDTPVNEPHSAVGHRAIDQL